MNAIFETLHWHELLKYFIEIVILFLILREIRELKRHGTALEKHETKLEAVRPLFSTVYTDSEEILKLAVQFTNDAKRLHAVGTIGVLSEIEMNPVSGHESWREKLLSVESSKRDYVAATSDFIQSGKTYFRVMNLLPQLRGEGEIWEFWANIRFFCRIMEDSGSKSIDLNLFHHPGLISGKEDFHYRCSDKAVIIRVGGALHEQSNSAISITDSRVIERFSLAYSNLINDINCVPLTLTHLQELDKAFSVKDFEKVQSVLEHI